MDPYTAAELARLEDALLRFSPARQWEIKAVTFPSTANTDLDIAHGLTPADNEVVGYQVLQAAQPVIVYHDTSATRTAWSSGVVRLRATSPSAQVILLLTVRDSSTDATKMGPVTDTAYATTPFEFTVPDLRVSDRVLFDGDLYLGAPDNLTLTGPTDLASSGAFGIGGPAFLGRIISAASGPGIAGAGAGTSFRTAGHLFWVTNETTTEVDVLDQSGTIGAAGQLLLPGNISTKFGEHDNALFIYDSTSEKYRVLLGAPQGHRGRWLTPTYDNANFTGHGVDADWDVASGDITTYAYSITGKTMTVSWIISTTSVSNTPQTLRIKIPSNYTAGSTHTSTIWWNENGTRGIGRCYVLAGDTAIYLEKVDAADWADATNTTSVQGQITFEIQ